MLAAVVSTGLVQAADDDPQNADNGCSVTEPCIVAQTTDGDILDTGGPGVLFVASDED